MLGNNKTGAYLQEQQQEARESMELQYTRIIQDLTAALQDERTLILKQLDSAGQCFVSQIQVT